MSIIILTGTTDVISRGILSARVTIKDDVILLWSYNKYTHEKETIKVYPLHEWEYRTNKDNSGQQYEVAEVDTTDYVYDIHKHDMTQGCFHIQTWNRATLYITCKYAIKGIKRGDREMETVTFTIELDDKSTEKFVEFIWTLYEQ